MGSRGRGRGRGGMGGFGFPSAADKNKNEKPEPPPLFPPAEFCAGFPKVDKPWIALVDRKREIECMFEISEHHLGGLNKPPDFNWDLFPSFLRPSEKRKSTKTNREGKKLKKSGDLTKTMDKYAEKEAKDDDSESDEEDAEKKKKDDESDGEEEAEEELEEANEYEQLPIFDDDEEYDEGGVGEDNDKE